MSKHAHTLIKECDPWLALSLAIISRARADAQKGDLSAVAFLLTSGSEIADKIADGTSETILTFCRQVLADVDRGALASKWAIFEY